MSPRGIRAENPVTAPSAVSRWLLDGQTYRVEAFEKGAKVFDDVLVFRDGTFFSEGCRKFGFDRSPYYVRVEGNQIRFLVETVSPTHGTMIWKGTVRENRIDGAFHWTKERWYWTVRRNFEVKGARDK